MPENPQNSNQVSDEVIEEIKEESEELDFNNPDYSFIPPDRHQWRQQGPYLICHSCELQHAIYIGMEKIMVGEDEEGNPILVKREGLTKD
jgi:hypothetical protein